MNRRLIITCIILCCVVRLSSVQKGSDTAVSIEPFFTFPAADNDNAMIGFGWFKNGFALEDATTSCTFNSVYPVSGTVDLAGGTLYLLQDLALQNITQLNGFGTIIGNGHSMDFGTSIDEIPTNIKVLQDVNLFFHHNVDLESSVTIRGNVLISAAGGTLDLEDGAAFIIDSNSTLELQSMLVENVHDDNIRCVDDTGHLVLDNIVWCQMGQMHYQYGDILFQNLVRMYGRHTFWYDSGMTCTIGDESTLKIDGGLNFKLGCTVPGGPNPLYMYDDNSVMSFGEATLTITGYGCTMARGIIESTVSLLIDAPSTSTSYGLIFGDGVSSEQDLTILFGPGSKTTFNSGIVVYNNTTGEGLAASAPSARFARMIGSRMHLATTCTFPQCIIEVDYNGISGPITTMASGVKLYCNKTNLNVPGVGAATITARREGTYACVFDDDGSMYFSGGMYPGNIKVNGTNNNLLGNGTLVGNIIFYDSNSTLTSSLEGAILGNISLNGGLFNLRNNIFFEDQANFSTTGTINIGEHLVDFGFNTTVFNVPLEWYSSNGCINLNSNVSLTSTWTINGICTINGNGNVFSLNEGGIIVIAPNSQLTIKNIIVDFVDTSDFRCVDDTGILVLDEVSWVQHGDYVFDKGSLQFKNSVAMSGDGCTLHYLSTGTATILRDAKLELYQSFIFDYAPSNSSRTLLQFDYESSTLKLNGGIFSVAPTGVELTNGILEIAQDSTLDAQTSSDWEGNIINVGITVGSGAAVDDLNINFKGDQTLYINGSLNYKNVQSDSLRMRNFSSFNIGQGCILRVYENIYLGLGSIAFGSGSIYARAIDKMIIGSINALGQFNYAFL